ncbi:MAG: hypothetical protein NVS9B9_07210 [Ktedonobacteraceae bacterium]
MRAYSAGGVVFRNTSLLVPEQNSTMLHTIHSMYDNAASTEHMHTVEVALVGRSHAGIWALPKGTPQPGETIEQVAVREAQEETGLQVRLIAYIGSISYSFVRDYLLEAIGGDMSLHDHEYDVVAWFPLHEACRLLTYQNEVNILYQAEDMLYSWLEQHGKGSE